MKHDSKILVSEFSWNLNTIFKNYNVGVIRWLLRKLDNFLFNFYAPNGENVLLRITHLMGGNATYSMVQNQYNVYIILLEKFFKFSLKKLYHYVREIILSFEISFVLIDSLLLHWHSSQKD